ncbi:hypothetical protein Vretifemale_6094, partial [Volvox reticuliferus]
IRAASITVMVGTEGWVAVKAATGGLAKRAAERARWSGRAESVVGMAVLKEIVVRVAVKAVPTVAAPLPTISDAGPVSTTFRATEPAAFATGATQPTTLSISPAINHLDLLPRPALEVTVFTKPTVAAPLPTIFDAGPISACKAAKPTASASGAKTPPPCPRDAPGTWAAEAASGGGEGGDRGGDGDGGEGGGEG